MSLRMSLNHHWDCDGLPEGFARRFESNRKVKYSKCLIDSILSFEIREGHSLDHLETAILDNSLGKPWKVPSARQWGFGDAPVCDIKERNTLHQFFREILGTSSRRIEGSRAESSYAMCSLALRRYTLGLPLHAYSMHVTVNNKLLFLNFVGKASSILTKIDKMYPCISLCCWAH